MRGLRVERLDHLGVVAGVCQELGLAAYVDELASSDRAAIMCPVSPKQSSVHLSPRIG